MLDTELKQQISSLNQKTYPECVYENALVTQFTANGFELYYFNKKGLGVIDFVLEHNDQVDLIEVRSGADCLRHPALTKISSRPKWNFRRKIVFCQSPSMEKDGVEYLPWYMVCLYRKPESEPVSFDFDFTSIQVPDSEQ